ncbi:MAG: hypothetical protein QXO32_03195 [Candidatus Bathyarchaeia archaeon]
MSVKPSSVVYWFRFILGILAGVVCFTLKMKGVQGFSTMVLVYVISYLIVKHGFRYGEKELKGKYKTVMIGIGTYIFTWAATWILLYSLSPYPLPSY